MTSPRSARAVILAASAVVALLSLTACGSAESASEPATADQSTTQTSATEGDGAAPEGDAAAHEGDDAAHEGDGAAHETPAMPATPAAVSPALAHASTVAGVPAGFPVTVPLPSAAALTAGQELGSGRTAAWRLQFTAADPQACPTFAQALTTDGYAAVVDGTENGQKAFALQGHPYDLTVLCSGSSMDVIVNPSL